jgi:hypothetical protein
VKGEGKCPLLALSGHLEAADERPVSGVKRTSQMKRLMSAYDQSGHPLMERN